MKVKREPRELLHPQGRSRCLHLSPIGRRDHVRGLETVQPEKASSRFAQKCRLTMSPRAFTTKIGSVSEAREVNVVLRLIRAQGRVVRREARTRSCCQIRGVEKEADMFDRYL